MGESLVLVTKSTVFQSFTSWNCLFAMRLLSRAVIYYHTSEGDKKLTGKQAAIFASVFDLLFSAGVKRMRKRDFYPCFKSCLLQTFSKCDPIVDKCSEISLNASENPKYVNF